jgi:ankyrin repeat protein
MDQDGSTALMYAAQEGHHECLSTLLAHGAEVNKAGAVSVRGVCSIAYSWDVAACIGAAAEGMRCNLLYLCCQL